MRPTTSILLACALAGAGAACSDANSLPDATLDNRVDTVTVFSLKGTPLTSPSGYSVLNARVVRTDQEDEFDFAYDVDTDAAGTTVVRRKLVPLGALGLSRSGFDPGMQLAEEEFGGIDRARIDGFTNDTALTAEVGSTYLLRSRTGNDVCSGLAAMYGKLQVLSFDDTPGQRSVTFQVLVNNNCGYLDLTPGLPED